MFLSVYVGVWNVPTVFLLTDLSARLVIHPSSLRPPVYSVNLEAAFSFDT
jgi:hypothetical protein